MKKKYIKPEFFMESFEVAEFVAAQCVLSWKHEEFACKLDGRDDYGMFLFSAGIGGCEIIVGNDDHNKYCYHKPTQEISNTYIS